MFKVNSRNSRTCDMFKVKNNDRRSMIVDRVDFGVDRVPYHRFPANIYLFKVNNIDTRIRCETCSKLTMNTSERSQ